MTLQEQIKNYEKKLLELIGEGVRTNPIKSVEINNIASTLKVLYLMESRGKNDEPAINRKGKN